MRKICLFAVLFVLTLSLAALGYCESTYVILKAALSDASILGTPVVADVDSEISYLCFDYTDNSILLSGRNSSGTSEYCFWTDVSLATSLATLTYVCRNFSDYHNSSNEWFVAFKTDEDSDYTLIMDEAEATLVAEKLEEVFDSSGSSSSSASSSWTYSGSSGSSYATSGERNALESAKSYIKYSGFSYSGLIDQLKYEGYSESEAAYGADNCGADWYDEALESAKSYIRYSAFSYSGLIDQLKFEGFTDSQAKYGADNCGADWNEEAVESAKSYLKYSSFSRSGLISQLEYEGFTHAQAQYGVSQAY